MVRLAETENPAAAQASPELSWLRQVEPPRLLEVEDPAAAQASRIMPWLRPVELPPRSSAARMPRCLRPSSVSAKLLGPGTALAISASTPSLRSPNRGGPRHHQELGSDSFVDPLAKFSRRAELKAPRTPAPPAERGAVSALAKQLDRQLSEARGFRDEMDAHATALHAICQQVSRQCADRGALLERLADFYTRSADVTFRQASNSVRRDLGERIDTLEEENASLRAELAQLRSDPLVGLSPREAVQRSFASVEQGQQLALARELTGVATVNELGQVPEAGTQNGQAQEAERRETTDLVAQSAEDAVDAVCQLLASQDRQSRVETIVAMTERGGCGGDQHLRYLRAMLGALPPSVRATFLTRELLEPARQRELWPAVFNAAADDDARVGLLLELFKQMPTKRSGHLVAQLLGTLERGAAVAVMHNLVYSHKEVKAQAELLSNLIGAADPTVVVDAVVLWRRSTAVPLPRVVLDALRVDLVEMMRGSEKLDFVELLLEQAHSQRDLLVRLACRSGPSGLPATLPDLLSALPDAARDRILGAFVDAFGRCPLAPTSGGRKLVEGRAERGGPEAAAASYDEVGARNLATLYAAQASVAARCACLHELTSNGVFGSDELELLLAHLGQVAPSSLKSFVEYTSNGLDTVATAANKVFSKLRRPKAMNGVAQVAAVELLPAPALLKQVSLIVGKKVSDDFEADVAGKERPRITKTTREFFVRTYGRTASSDAYRTNMVHSVKVIASQEASPLRLRMAHFGGMLGVVGEEWAEAKTNFYLGVLVRVLALDAEMGKRWRALRASGATDGEISREVSKVKISRKDAAGPDSLTATLASDQVFVRLPAVLATLDIMVSRGTDAKQRRALQQVMERCAMPSGAAGSSADPTPILNLDDVLATLANAWQDAHNIALAEQTQRLTAAFYEHDSNKDEVLDFGEFRRLLGDVGGASITEEDQMDIFDRALCATAEHIGEETDSVTKTGLIAAFQTISSKLKPNYQVLDSAFVDPVKLLRQSESMGKSRSSLKGKFNVIAAGTSATSAASQLMRVSKGAKNLGKSSRDVLVAAASAPADASAVSSAGPKDAKTKEALRQAIGSNFLFSHLDASGLEEVLSRMQKQTCLPGDAVIKQGEKGDFFYVCLAGSYNVLIDTKIVHTYTADPYKHVFPCFGELALMYAKPRAASVVALEDGVAWKLDRAMFRRLQSVQGKRDLTKTLRRVEAFSSLKFAQLQQLRDAMQEVAIEDGEFVFRQGDDPTKSRDAFYVVVAGSAIVLKGDGEGGAEREVGRLEENSYFGELALLHREPRGASVRAVGKLLLSFVTRDVFEKLLGPLGDMMEAARLRREAAQTALERQVESFGLSRATRDDFALERMGSELHCGALFLATHVGTNTVYSLRQEAKAEVAAVKEQPRVKRELEILRLVNEAHAKTPCSSLPSLLAAFQTEHSLYLLFKERAVCDLSVLLEQTKWHQAVSEAEVRFAAACVLQALQVLHADCGYLYRNIVPFNLQLLDNGYVSLMDHRLAKHDEGECRTLCGSPAYVAPEMVKGQTQTAATDLWGLGVLLFELTTGQPPWQGDEMMLFKSISAHESVAMPEMVSPNLASLISGLLVPAMRSRLTGDECQRHDWFDEVSWPRMLVAEVHSPLLAFVEAQLATPPPEPPAPYHESRTYQAAGDAEWYEAFSPASASGASSGYCIG